MNIDLSIYETTIIPAIIFIIWIALQTGLPKKFAPVFAVVLGVVAGLVFVSMSAEGVLTGLLIAAAAVGFNSGFKNIAEGATKNVRHK